LRVTWRYVARAGRFDLDDVGAEVGHHRAGDSRGDETAAIDHFQALKNSGHGIPP
jgi:hypothetical protein